MSSAIEFENISKQYRLGLVSTGTLSHDLNRFWQTKVLRREDPYLKVGEVNDRAHKGASEYVWALKDINFKVEQGDVVGIIGRNGAGKSTLLKLLSRVTAPTTGTIRARGRIASLLEVGTGFHPEMTGRENIYMNGAIMGMSRSEITRKLDEIVDFSGCERYLDTPVKRYPEQVDAKGVCFGGSVIRKNKFFLATLALTLLADQGAAPRGPLPQGGGETNDRALKD